MFYAEKEKTMEKTETWSSGSFFFDCVVYSVLNNPWPCYIKYTILFTNPVVVGWITKSFLVFFPCSVKICWTIYPFLYSLNSNYTIGPNDINHHTQDYITSKIFLQGLIYIHSFILYWVEFSNEVLKYYWSGWKPKLKNNTYSPSPTVGCHVTENLLGVGTIRIYGINSIAAFHAGIISQNLWTINTFLAF